MTVSFLLKSKQSVIHSQSMAVGTYLVVETAVQQKTVSPVVSPIMEAVMPAGPQHQEKTSPGDHLKNHTHTRTLHKHTLNSCALSMLYSRIELFF